MKHLFLPLALALVCSAGCRIVIDDGSGGGGGSTAYDDGGSYDDGGQYDDGGTAQNDPPPARRDPPPARRRNPPPRRRSEPKKRVVRGPKRFVGGYRSAYPRLPDLGKTGANFWGAGKGGPALQKGYMRGDLKAKGPNGVIKQGAGHGQTVIDGHLEIRGNRFIFRDMTITGNVDIKGDHNDISGCQIFGRVKIRGVGNKTP